MSVLALAPVGPVSWIQSGSEMTIAFVFPGQGSQAVGMGEAFSERVPDRQGDPGRGRRRSRTEPVAHHPRGPRRRSQADRERAARLDGGQHRRAPGDRPGVRFRYFRAGDPCRRPLPRRIFRARRRGCVRAAGRGATAQDAGEGDAGGGAGRRRRDGGPARRHARPGERDRNGCGRGPGLRYRQRQRARPGGAFRQQGGGGARGGAWPGSAASGAPSCSRFRHRSTAVCCSRRPRR